MSTPAAEARAVTTPMLLRLYAGLLELSGPLLRLYLRRRRNAGKEDATRFEERRGIASVARPDGLLIWFHAASVGESMSMLRLIERVLAERPEARILVTTGTVTSARVIVDRLAARAIHQYIPVDRRAWTERFLDHWEPDGAIWIEFEIWPNLLAGIARRKIPAALVNARMSSRSYARWSMVPRFAEQLLGTFDLCLAQTETEAVRLDRLGARDVRYVGHLKYAADPLPADPIVLASLQQAIGARPLWVLASSHEGEEAMAIAAHRLMVERFPRLLTIIVPRHTSRGGAIAEFARAAGLRTELRSQTPSPSAENQIYIVDAMGELGLWYRLAPIACIGGSLTPIGGHNPIEAAQLDCALLYGPHMFSVAGVAAELQEAGAAEIVSDADSLSQAVARLLGDPDRARTMAAEARAVAERNRHVIDRAFAALTPVLDRAIQRSGASRPSI